MHGRGRGLGESLENGEEEEQGLAGACLGAHEEVPTAERERDGVALDLVRREDVHALEGGAEVQRYVKRRGIGCGLGGEQSPAQGIVVATEPHSNQSVLATDYDYDYDFVLNCY